MGAGQPQDPDYRTWCSCSVDGLGGCAICTRIRAESQEVLDVGKKKELTSGAQSKELLKSPMLPETNRSAGLYSLVGKSHGAEGHITNV